MRRTAVDVHTSTTVGGGCDDRRSRQVGFLIFAENLAEHAANFADGRVVPHGVKNRRHEVLGFIPGGLARGRPGLRSRHAGHGCPDLVQAVDLALTDLFADLEQLHPRGFVVRMVIDSDDDLLFPLDLHRPFVCRPIDETVRNPLSIAAAIPPWRRSS